MKAGQDKEIKRNYKKESEVKKERKGKTRTDGETNRGQPLHHPRDVLFKSFPPLLHHVWVHVAEEILLRQCVDNSGLGWKRSSKL